ncbi:MAG: hypothetical protein IT458_03625, partial [Planctomycetes bacterium]|nr:hypothetical protein [Planctomycetota bacterium]
MYRAARWLLALLIPTALLAQTPATREPASANSVTAKLLEEGRQRSQVMDHLDHLVNEIGPRLTGSKRLTQAQEW